MTPSIDEANVCWPAMVSGRRLLTVWNIVCGYQVRGSFCLSLFSPVHTSPFTSGTCFIFAQHHRRRRSSCFCVTFLPISPWVTHGPYVASIGLMTDVPVNGLIAAVFVPRSAVFACVPPRRSSICGTVEPSTTSVLFTLWLHRCDVSGLLPRSQGPRGGVLHKAQPLRIQ